MRFIITFSLLAVQYCFANVVISGQVSDFRNEELIIQGYHDFITNAKYGIKKVQLSESGKFKVDLQITQQTLIEIKIRDRAAELYVLPSREYDLKISDDDGNSERLFDKRLTVEYVSGDPNELNTLMAEFNIRYAKFLDENYDKFLTVNVKQVVSDFKSENLAYFGTKKNETFMQSLNYQLGNLEDATIHNKKTIYEHLIKSKKILYHNQEFMTFFTQFYQDRFRQLALGKDGFEILASINSSTDLARLKGLLQKDIFLDDDPCLELFIINGLFEVYNDPTFKKSMVKKMLKYISLNSQYNEHQKIAKQILYELNFLKPGSKAPDFELQAADGSSVNLASFPNKYKYFQFWATWSVPSVKEQLVMNKLYEKYGDEILFVSISAERLESLKNDGKSSGYRWQFLYQSDRSSIMEKYRIRSVPTYMILDRSNRIVQFPADSPISVEKQLYDLSIKK